MTNLTKGCKNISEIDSDALGLYVEEQMQGVCLKLVELKPFIAELWKRFDDPKRTKTIRGCDSKTQYSEQILHRKLQTVRLMLADKISPSKSIKPQLETSCEHLEAVHKLREWMEREIPKAAKRLCITPCGFGYDAGMGQGLKPGELSPSFDLELRNLTADEVKNIGRHIENL